MEDLFYCEDSDSDSEVVHHPEANAQLPKGILQSFEDNLVYEKGPRRVARRLKRHFRPDSTTDVKVREIRERGVIPFKDIASLRAEVQKLPNTHYLTIFLEKQEGMGKTSPQEMVGTLRRGNNGSVSFESQTSSAELKEFMGTMVETLQVDTVEPTKPASVAASSQPLNDLPSTKTTTCTEPSTKVKAPSTSRNCISALATRISALAKRVLQALSSFFSCIKRTLSLSNWRKKRQEKMLDKSLQKPLLSPTSPKVT